MSMPFNLLLLKTFHAQKNRIRPLMAEIGLSPGQPKVLAFLDVHSEVSQKDLAIACDIEPATISKLLDSLEQKSLIVRSNRPGDRRVIAVRLSESGEQLVREQILPRYAEVNGASLAGFSDEEKQRFEAYLRRMHKNLCGALIE